MRRLPGRGVPSGGEFRSFQAQAVQTEGGGTVKRRRSGMVEDSGVDLTPMLDVVFILLIFFIVTATFVRERGIDVLRPDNNEEEQQVQNVFPILVFINNQNDIQLNDPRTGEPRTIDVRTVRANIERLRVDNPKGPVVIQAEPEAAMGITMQVLDQARLANAPSVTISTVEG